MNEYNIRGLVHDAKFKVKLANSLFWVPLNTLGYSKYKTSDFTTDDIVDIEYVRSIISNPYEAFQYLNAIKFKEIKDVYYKSEKGILWEHHIDGNTSITHRSGCCTSVAAALSVLLEGRFEKMGYIFFIRPDTSNHALNYIFINEKFYIFDSSACVYGDSETIAFENGNLASLKNRIITSICIEADSLESFVCFHRRIHLYNKHRFIYFEFPYAHKCIDKIFLKKEVDQLYVRFPYGTEFRLLSNIDEEYYSLDFV